MAVAVVVARGLIRCFLPIPHRLQLLFAGVAAIGETLLQQGMDGGAMLIDAFALDHGFFIPIQPQPLQTIKDVLGVFEFRSLPIGVFDAEDETAALTAGEQPIEYCGSSRADMERARRAGGQTNAPLRYRVDENGTDGIRTRNFRRDRAVL